MNHATQVAVNINERRLEMLQMHSRLFASFEWNFCRQIYSRYWSLVVSEHPTELPCLARRLNHTVALAALEAPATLETLEGICVIDVRRIGSGDGAVAAPPEMIPLTSPVAKYGE